MLVQEGTRMNGWSLDFVCSGWSAYFSPARKVFRNNTVERTSSSEVIFRNQDLTGVSTIFVKVVQALDGASRGRIHGLASATLLLQS